MPKHYLTVEEKRAIAFRDMQKVIAACGPRVLVRAIANNMAAGPCRACLAAAAWTVPASEAPLPPFDECPHPDQCAVLYVVELDLD